MRDNMKNIFTLLAQVVYIIFRVLISPFLKEHISYYHCSNNKWEIELTNNKNETVNITVSM